VSTLPDGVMSGRALTPESSDTGPATQGPGRHRNHGEQFERRTSVGHCQRGRIVPSL